ncbi:hypothetical protein [Pseudomonas sp. RC10]|uniref:hypothetical protein n=1 Tax=Pseudomonas bambusae TaxID=3139142 RepID=UPI00313A3F4D
MNLNSARQVWHDCGYNPFRSSLVGLEERCLLGTAVQITDRGVTADLAAHSTLAGWFQSVIDKIHPQVRVFGDFMYAAQRDEDIREAAEEVVYGMTLSKMPRMTALKKAKAVFVAKGVMYRYQHMHQGGQSANPDPLAKPETFRAWLFDHYGVRIESVRWAREWEGFIKTCFECCEDLDRMALSPVAGLIYEMKTAA